MKKECKKSCKQEVAIALLLFVVIGMISFNYTGGNITGHVVTGIESNFDFTTSNSYVSVSFPSTDGAVELYLFYGNSTEGSYTGLGKKIKEKLVIPSGNIFNLNETENSYFIMSTGESKSYFYKIKSITDQDGSNVTELGNIVSTGNDLRLKSVGDYEEKDTLRITLISANDDKGVASVQVTADLGTVIFNRVYDTDGNYFDLPQLNKFPFSEYNLSVFNASDNLIEMYSFTWSLTQPNITESSVVPSSCTPNWVASNTSCTSSENKIQYYSDVNGCGVTTDMPANKTVSCDYDGNGLIGNTSNVNLQRYDVEFEVNGEQFNFSASYNGTRKIEFVENESVIVEFDWNFANALDFTVIELKRQLDSADRGSLVVKGLEVNKTVYVDRIAGDSRVCIKDAEIDSPNDISYDCSESDEYILNCPGSVGGYSCSIVNRSFKITGLMHSAVVEFEGDNASSSNCSASWSCTDWTFCEDNNQTRVCSDINNCNDDGGKPIESQTCVPECISSWSCTEWEKCKDAKQVRACVDRNECSIATNKPSPFEERDCEAKKINWPIILTILGVLIVLGIIVAIIFYFLNKSAEDGELGSVNAEIPPINPPMVPGSVQSPTPKYSRPKPPITRPLPIGAQPAKSAPMPAPSQKPAAKPITKPSTNPSSIPPVSPPPK